MSEINKTYRIKTNIGEKISDKYISVDANILQDYDTIDILSVKIKSSDTYKLHNANYGVVVGRVLANNGFGVPNAKLSFFIESDSEDGIKLKKLYPFTNVASRDVNNVQYNLLPDEKINDCHSVVGTFPNKRYVLDNDTMIEVFDKYYKYTTRTNHAGDYLFIGVPVGAQTLHMDLDLSDCGVLSQRPRDFVYKGYNIEQFENPNMFKDGHEFTNLSQVFSQNQIVTVQPFWGNESLGENIGITRADINIAFKFEPTCVFMGSIIIDNYSNGISKKCIPTENMGYMEELTTGEGTIEMIRKTPSGSIEEFQIKGNQLIDGNGVWCYQIPMNLDYMMTDEYGNMVPTDNPDIGIPTRASVRFRISMHDSEENIDNFFRGKVLVPHNPQMRENSSYEEYDYEFGSLTKDESFRDLFWNNVYSVKSYIPRLQKRRVSGWKEKKFTGIKGCNFHGSNNPFPYNNMRIKLRFMFIAMCILVKTFVFVISIINSVLTLVGNALANIGNTNILGGYPLKKVYKKATDLTLISLNEGLCPDLENWFFAPMLFRSFEHHSPPKGYKTFNMLKQTLERLRNDNGEYVDNTSIDVQNDEEVGDSETICLSTYTDYLMSCIEMNLAMEYRVVNFDFYNDWVNGTIYFPRFMRVVKPKLTFFGYTIRPVKIKGCMDDSDIFSKSRRYVQQCSLSFKPKTINNRVVYTNVKNPLKGKKKIVEANNFHKKKGFSHKAIFGDKGGICHEHTTLKGQHVYYMKPCEWHGREGRKATLFANDIILLGSLNECDLHGIPQAFKYLSSSSYVMPTNLALTNMETDGPIYTNKGTVCLGKNGLTSKETENGARVTVLPPSCGLTAELLAYENAQTTLYDVNYEGNEPSDIIALTEAAGISWNYTGPGQGEKDEEKLYYPGGHFLGLSCMNSQTNLKSCVNLSRICEVGANMSQRYEDISSVDGNVMTYTFTVPSGLISGNDIVGGEFRSMFATMNHKPLKATKINPMTGYKMYDMDFVRPTNFNGIFQSLVDGETPYNKKIDIDKPDESTFNRFGIACTYDEDELNNTQTRTIEDASIDYYRFRLGLDVKDLTKSSKKHTRRFLLEEEGARALPQYENSYYFYFGLKNGATAFEEFNKQFFSECDNSMLTAGESTIEISPYDEPNACKAVADIIVSTRNIEPPFQFIEIISDVEFVEAYDDDGNIIINEFGDIVKSKNLLIVNGDKVTKYDDWLNSYYFVISGCPFGNYRVSIRDANDILYTKTEKIGYDFISYDCNIFDFNFNINESNKVFGEYIHKGGYVSVSNVFFETLPNVEEDGEEKAVKFKLHLIKSNLATDNQTNKEEISSADGKNGDKKEYILSALEGGLGRYELWVSYDCDNSTEDKTFENVKILLTTFEIKDNSSLGLNIGVEGFSSKTMDYNSYKYGWWSATTINDDSHWIDRAATFNSSTNREKEASSIGITSVGGSKVLWGCAQNSKGGFTDKVYCSETYEDIPNGYTLDDEYVHHPTYKFEGNGSYTEKTPFSCSVFDGTMVMGRYTAFLDNGIIRINKTQTYEHSKHYKDCMFNDGCGYIFKPLPYGDLQFHVYDSKNGLKYTQSDEENFNNGIFYPSIPYHSMDRSFDVKTNFYCWADRDVVLTNDDVGGEKIVVSDRELGCKTEITILNGLTYSGEFDSSCYATGFPEKYEWSVGDFKDTYGLTENEKTDRKLVHQHFNGDSFSKATTDIDSYGFNITEGAYKVYENNEVILDGTEYVNSVYGNIESNFAEYITYEASEYHISRINPVGGNVSAATYYLALVNARGDNNKFIVGDGEGIIYYKKGNKTYYVLCTYNSNAEYDDYGAPVIVKLVINSKKKVTYTYNVTNENGEIVSKSAKIKDGWNTDNSNVIERIKNIITNKLPGYDVSYVRKYVISPDYRENYKGEWCKLIERDTIDWKNPNFKYTGGVLYAYGVIEDTETNARLYKIYPNIVKLPIINEEENIFIDELSNKTELEFDSNIGEKTINIIATKDYAWSTSIEDIISNNSGNWVKIEPSTGVGGGKETPTKVYIRVNPNDNEKERQVKITFSINEDELDDTLNTSHSKYSIIVKQKNKNNDENLDSDVTPNQPSVKP